VAQNPGLLYQPVKDVLIGTKQFAKDVLEKPTDVGLLEYTKARREISNLLRDWEGGRMAGELEIDDFANYIKGHLKTQDKLEAMSHYMEGNLEGYKRYREALGLAPVTLTSEDVSIAPVIRKFFDDMAEWDQRSALFQEFRGNKKLYNAARNWTDEPGLDYTKGKGGKELQQEVWDYVQRLEDPFAVAKKVAPWVRRKTRKNYIPHATRREFAPTDQTIDQTILSDAHRAQQIQTRSRFTKARTHDTLVDALEGGETLLTQDVSSLIKMYGRSVVRAQLNNRLMSQLRKTKTPSGVPLITTKDKAPKHYVEFKHDNFKERGPEGEYLRVNPNVAPDLRLYFDTNDPNIVNRVLQNIILISKRSALGLSLFHMMALAWSGLATGQPIGQVAKNLLPMGRSFKSRGLLALAGEEGYDEILRGMRNGLGIGVLEELKGNTLINAQKKCWQVVSI
jgi:hypothetical protein